MKSRAKWALIAAVLAGTVAVSLLAIRRGGRHVSPRIVEGLKSDDAERVGKSLRALTESEDPVAVPQALPLLRSDDAYVWINAALYLGAVRRPEAVPYLIKAGLKKCEWAYSGARKSLTAITGQDFGTDFPRWREWWEKTNPGAAFDFEGDRGP
jgi:hypothetical protein